MKSIFFRILCVVLSALLWVIALPGCSDQDGPDGVETWEAVSKLISTYYSAWYGDRDIYVKTSGITATPVVDLTFKQFGKCGSTSKVMNLLPASSTTTTICAGLGLTYKKLANGTVLGCYSSTNTSVPVYHYRFNDWTATELNYRVRDAGGIDKTPWLPGTPGNGCARPKLAPVSALIAPSSLTRRGAMSFGARGITGGLSIEGASRNMEAWVRQPLYSGGTRPISRCP